MSGDIFDGPAPRIARDRLPVTVSTEAGEVCRNARAVLTMPDEDGVGAFLVWASPSPRNPVVNTTWNRHASDIGATGVDWTIDTPEGAYTLSGRGCGGCSPLAHMPWPWGAYRMGILQ